MAGFHFATKSYGDLSILKNTPLHIERGDKIALIGANGKGKSTLLRIVAGTEAFDGKMESGHNVMTSFYAQHQLEALNIEHEILEELKMEGTGKSEQELRNVLGCFLFSEDEVFKKIKVLSGGEKSRVALAKTLISEANFLLLDEPTNHLDMLSVSILVQALQQYEGTFLLVSHDRHFISQVANKIWYIENHQLKVYPGTYEEFSWWQKQQSQKQAKTETQPEPVKTKAKVATKTPTDGSAKADKERKKVEAEIERLEEEISELETQLAQPEVYGNDDELKRMTEAYEDKKKQLDDCMTAWEKMVSA
jgi:ATP-binding cassette subfamily F protein 3